MRIVFVDANATLAGVAERLFGAAGVGLGIHRDPDVKPEELPAVLGDAAVALIDHTYLPTAIAWRCGGLREVVFLGTGARSYMNPEELAELGIRVHIIPGYGDTAVAEMTIALMWAAARSVAWMDREMRAGRWQRTDGVQLSGKTLGLIGFGGIAKEVARLAGFMRVIAWNRTPKEQAGVEFVELERLLAESDVVSMHLVLNDETRGFLSAERMEMMKRGAMLVNTARGALVDEAAMMAALQTGQIGHAALDVFVEEPLAVGHPLTTMDNVTLSAHSAFRTSEASENLIRLALKKVQEIG
jgi:D-3-phosphoglycerate dehydrogenase